MTTTTVHINTDILSRYMRLRDLDRAMQYPLNDDDGFDRRVWDDVPDRTLALAIDAGFTPEPDGMLDIDDVTYRLRDAEWDLCDAVADSVELQSITLP